MSTTALIFAAGDQVRWPGGVPKQLARVGSETVIGRIMRQCRARGVEPVVITYHPLLVNAAIEAGAVYALPADRRWLAETIRSTCALWQDTTHLLLGDVIYSKALMDTILGSAPALRFYGKHSELLALSFTEAEQERLTTALDTVIDHAAGSDLPNGVGKLWNVYRAVEGWPLLEHRWPPGALFEVVHDWSIDVDTPQLYERFASHTLKTGLLDDVVEVETGA